VVSVPAYLNDSIVPGHQGGEHRLWHERPPNHQRGHRCRSRIRSRQKGHRQAQRVYLRRNLRCVPLDDRGVYLRGQGHRRRRHLGGEDFVNRLVNHFAQQFKRKNKK
ncbi:hypothetical protein C8R44DRAFT_948874, partial [Mycena epipterygia]